MPNKTGKIEPWKNDTPAESDEVVDLAVEALRYRKRAISLEEDNARAGALLLEVEAKLRVADEQIAVLEASETELVEIAGHLRLEIASLQEQLKQLNEEMRDVICEECGENIFDEETGVTCACIPCWNKREREWQSKRESLQAQLKQHEWVPVEDKPKSGKRVLIKWLNSYGAERTSLGWFAKKHDIPDEGEHFESADYCEEKDEYYFPEGFWEVPYESEMAYPLSNIVGWKPITLRKEQSNE